MGREGDYQVGTEGKEEEEIMDGFDKWIKVLLTILVVIFLWSVVMMTVTAFHEMREPQYCPNCGSVIEGE